MGANYRLIDIPVSNCINSDINKMAGPGRCRSPRNRTPFNFRNVDSKCVSVTCRGMASRPYGDSLHEGSKLV